MPRTEPLTEEDRRIAKTIKDLGAAAETEIQACTLLGLDKLRGELDELESHGLLRRRRGYFGGRYGDALQLTGAGYDALGADVEP